MTDIIINDVNQNFFLEFPNPVCHIKLEKEFIEKMDKIIQDNSVWASRNVYFYDTSRADKFEVGYKVENSEGQAKYFVVNAYGPSVAVFKNIKPSYKEWFNFTHSYGDVRYGSAVYKSLDWYVSQPQDFLKITETARIEFNAEPYSPDYEYCFLTVENAQLTVNDDFYKSGEILTYHDLKTASLTFSDATKSGDVIMCKRIPQGDVWNIFYNDSWAVESAWHYDPKK